MRSAMVMYLLALAGCSQGDSDRPQPQAPPAVATAEAVAEEPDLPPAAPEVDTTHWREVSMRVLGMT